MEPDDEDSARICPTGTSDRALALARRCTEAVLRDLETTTGIAPTSAVDRDEWHGGVRIVIDGGYTAPSMTCTEPADALVEVADYIQSQLTYDLGFAWPVCGLHDLGLHARLHGGVPSWWCPGDHIVAPIGGLSSAS